MARGPKSLSLLFSGLASGNYAAFNSGWFKSLNSDFVCFAIIIVECS